VRPKRLLEQMAGKTEDEHNTGSHNDNIFRKNPSSTVPGFKNSCSGSKYRNKNDKGSHKIEISINVSVTENPRYL
jgi:hypothetical protein